MDLYLTGGLVPDLELREDRPVAYAQTREERR